VLRLPFEGGTLTAQGVTGDETAQDDCPSWEAAAGIELSVLPGPLRDGEVTGIDVRVTDKTGRWVRSWCGDARVEVCGAGDAHPFTQDGCVRLAGGAGRIYLTRPASAGDVTLCVTAGELLEGRLVLPA
jgi:hypothetical protein